MQRSNLKVGLSGETGGLFDVPNLTGTPERNLLLAILERAALDYVGNDPQERQAVVEWIEDYLKNKDKIDHNGAVPFTFVWVCKQLDLNPDNIARKILTMPKRGNRKVAPWYFLKEIKNN
ncbi:MAG: hypothetical protein D6780_08380 [Candidatus Dadabacteria bacterium]|nr:MAG: hypothetical protein D6780_08380 [Candidatus Dadabacteria bacterium]